MILLDQRLGHEGEGRIGRHQGRAGWRQQSVYPIGDDFGVLAEANDRRPQAGIGTAADIANVAVPRCGRPQWTGQNERSAGGRAFS